MLVYVSTLVLQIKRNEQKANRKCIRLCREQKSSEKIFRFVKFIFLNSSLEVIVQWV